jgi:5S rRNA maturation endonuclease (ribonuclease M5)
MSFGIYLSLNRYVVTSVSKERNAFIVRVKQCKKKSRLLALLDPDNEGVTLLRNVGKYLPINMT